MRSVYIISDLHVGGAYPKPPEPGKRGFRLCTHADAIASFINYLIQNIDRKGPIELVLNGDTIDFLAERDESPNSWSAFTAKPDRAVAKLEAIVERDKVVFDSLKEFLQKGGRLTVLLGNHDVELSLPSVRSAFRHALGVKAGHAFDFLYDGEAYIVSDALIEHGNRYDAWNQIDYDALRRIRSLQSRRQEVPDAYVFGAPAGSEMVASVINPIKLQYPFVDLLKPEQTAVVPMLLALEPGYRSLLGTIALLAYGTRAHGLASAALPKYGGDANSELDASNIEFGRGIASESGLGKMQFGGDMSVVATAPPHGTPSEEDVALKRALHVALGDEAENFLSELEAEMAAADPLAQIGAPISVTGAISTAFGFAALLSGRKSQSYEKRLPALLRAMRGVQNKDTFDVGKETALEYLNAARDLAGRGFRYVVFGHTHQAKNVDLGNNRYYLNSGTWADVLQFPDAILSAATEAEALNKLHEFVAKMRSGDFSTWTPFKPTYIRFELDNSDKITEAVLETFSGTSVP